jgi:septum formation protein
MSASVDAPPVVLASGSLRRRRLLQLLGIPFSVRPAEIEEIPEPGEKPADFVCRAAREKALAISEIEQDAAVLGADTIVELDGMILGKPRSPADAVAMLRSLSSKEHRVHTALALAVEGSCHELLDTAKVEFLSLNDRMIYWYVGTGEPLDKAGAYGIQGLGGLFVAGVHGSPHTVVGLPIHRLPELFRKHQLDFWSLLEASSDRHRT